MQTQQTNLRALTFGADSFGEVLMILHDQAGLSRSRAIMRGAQMHPSLYRKWMLDRNAGRITEKRGGRSIMSHFKIIGG